jgi:hypothetical protein
VVALLLSLGHAGRALPQGSHPEAPASALPIDDPGSAERAAHSEPAASAIAHWSWRPTLLALAAFERDIGLTPLVGRDVTGTRWQPALALALDVERVGPRVGFQGALFALGRGPFEHHRRQFVLDARAQAFGQWAGGWRLDGDASARLERHNATALTDFQRHDLALTLERRGARGPAWRLRATEGQRDVPRLAGLDVRRFGLALGPVFALPRGTNLAQSAVFEHDSAAVGRGWRAGLMLEASQVRAGRAWALRYGWSAALYRTTASANLGLPGSGVAAAGVGADFLTQAARAMAPPPVAEVGPEPAAVPLADTLDGDEDGLPARRRHVLALYASQRLGSRLRFGLGAQFAWRRELDDRAQDLRTQRVRLRATLRLRVARRLALLAQVAHATATPSTATPRSERMLVHLGLQLF